MSAPSVFEPIIQKSTEDCSIACLAMLLGLPYAVVREAAPRNLERQGGLYIKQVVALAAKFGETLTLNKFDDDEEEQVGILSLTRAKGKGAGHVVVYIKGVVWTTASGTLWADLDAYLKTHGFVVDGILVKEDK